MVYKSYSPEETENIAFDFSKNLSGGQIITLDGDLGAGKTAFVRGIARGLEITDNVSSPTFTIVNEYRKGRIPLFHFDVYRISSEEEMFDIGWDDYISQNAVVVVEWASNIEQLFSEDGIIRIEITKDLSVSEDYRQITIKGTV